LVTVETMTADSRPMRVVVHLDPNAPSRVLGIWIPTHDGPPRPYYPEVSAAEASGTDFVLEMASRWRWANAVGRLVSVLPYEEWWESIDVDSDLTDDAAFALAASFFKAHVRRRGPSRVRDRHPRGTSCSARSSKPEIRFPVLS
jgi:hypothetical protein